MEIKFLNQPKDVKIGEILVQRLNKGTYARIWLLAGFTKDSGLDYLLEAVKKARKFGTIVELIVGVDKKNTSKDMLLKFMEIGCRIRFHINDDNSKLETRFYAFESDTESSFIYLTGAKLSEGGLTENIALITEIKYSLNEKREFNKAKASIESGLNTELFEVLTKERLTELASTGEIVARITERKIPSISQLYSGETESVIQEYDESTSSKYNELAKQEIDIDIDFSDNINIQSSLGEEVELKIKSEKEENTMLSKLVLNEKEVNYELMNTLILPISKVSQKGVTAGEIKIPAAIAIKMNKFFDYPQKFHMEEDENGKLKEMKKIELEIYENILKQEMTDKEVKIIQTGKATIIKSPMLAHIEIKDNDIMRLIKEDEGKYRCEIIKLDSSEYNVWENFCTVSVKGTSKKFGVI